MNALANEALPLFLDKLVPAYVAVIISVTLVLFIGEIIPTAIFTGPNQLAISSKLVPLVKFVLLILSPIAWPIAKLLDYFLHSDDAFEKYDKYELGALIRLQFKHRRDAKKKIKLNKVNVGGGTIHDGDTLSASSRFIKVVDEVLMVEGALGMHSKKVADVMQPWSTVYTIPNDLVLTKANIVDIYRSGHSRVPVYERKEYENRRVSSSSSSSDITRNICGLFMVKQLVVVDSQDKRSISTLPLTKPYVVEPGMNLVDLINLLQEGRSKMAIVCYSADVARDALSRGESIPQSAEVLGLVTLEDCLEELIQEEIYDEYDKKEMLTRKRMRWVADKWKAFVKKKKDTRLRSNKRMIDESTSLIV